MTSCFDVTEHSWQGPATSCKIFPGSEMAETSRHSGVEKVTLFDATLCHGYALITSRNIMFMLCSLCDLRGSWHTTWQTSCHAAASCKMRRLMLLHHNEIICLCIYLNHVSGFSSLSPCCWECDRRLITKWNNSGNKRSDLGKAIRSRLSWFKALLLRTEVSNLFLAFGQWLYLGEMENKGFVHQF